MKRIAAGNTNASAGSGGSIGAGSGAGGTNGGGGVGGSSGASTSLPGGMLWRLTDAGALDASFGDGGAFIALGLEPGARAPSRRTAANWPSGASRREHLEGPTVKRIGCLIVVLGVCACGDEEPFLLGQTTVFGAAGTSGSSDHAAGNTNSIAGASGSAAGGAGGSITAGAGGTIAGAGGSSVAGSGGSPAGAGGSIIAGSGGSIASGSGGSSAGSGGSSASGSGGSTAGSGGSIVAGAGGSIAGAGGTSDQGGGGVGGAAGASGAGGSAGAAGQTIASGVLDPSFNGVGYVTRQATAGGTFLEDGANNLAIDALGRIVVVGASTLPNNDYVGAVWRLTDDGVFDDAFGTTGAWFPPPPAGSATYGVTIDALNRPIVVGRTTNDNGTTMWRLTDAGGLDASFGDAGTFAAPGLEMGAVMGLTAYDVTLDGGGEIVSTGYANADISVWRTTAAGVSDDTFGTGGLVLSTDTTTAPGDVAKRVIIDAAGRIVVVGVGYTPDDYYGALVLRFTSAGVLDATFGTGGRVLLHALTGGTGPNAGDFGYAVREDAAGGLIVAGYTTFHPAPMHGFLVRLGSDGAVDPSFGASGLVLLPPRLGDSDTVATDMVIDAHGRLVVCGVTESNTTVYAAAWRYSGDGVIDPTFGDGGIFSILGTNTPDLAVAHDYAAAVVVDALDRPVIAGQSAIGKDQSQVAIWRLTP